MKFFIITAFLLVSFNGFSNADTGMQFIHGTTWQQVKDKARAEKKFIFVDAFTTWCGPCRVMAKNIFPLEAVGNFYNEKYINLKVQLDTTSKDNEEVKSWYGDARDIRTLYNVNVFPTYLFFSPEGKLVHRAVGSSEADVFITKGKDALDPSKQYYTLAERYVNGDRDPLFLKSLAEASLNAYDRDVIGKYSLAYLRTQTNMVTEDNIHFIDAMTQSVSDTGFGIMLANKDAFNKVLGEQKAEEKIKRMVLQEEVYPMLFSSREEPNWVKLEQDLETKYKGLGGEIIAGSKVVYYNNKNKWPEFSKAVNAYVKNYGKKVSALQLNQYAWKIFQNCEDIACIQDALAWSKKSVDLTNSPMYMDTYANLLYKSGKNKQAIEWEEKALRIAKAAGESEDDYKESLNKMKKGEKTW